MNRKIIYTAGPITTDSLNERWVFHMNAREMARQIWKSGHAAICPHLNTMFMDGPDIDNEVFYKGDEDIIRRCCDAMVMLPGYTKSKGSLAERYLAHKINIPVFYYDQIGQMWNWLGVEVPNATY